MRKIKLGFGTGGLFAQRIGNRQKKDTAGSDFTLSDFLKNRWISITAAVLAAAVSAAVFAVPVTELYAAVCVPALFLIGEAAALALEYRKRRLFYRNLYKRFNRMDQKYRISEVLPSPNFLEGRILCAAMRGVTKSVDDEVGQYRRQMREYREFLKSWADEIEPPISACRLILQNCPGKLSDDLQDDFYRIQNYVDQAAFYAHSVGTEKDCILKPCLLRDLVSSALQKNAGLLLANGVRLETESLDYTVPADAEWMNFILGQIIINSVKFRQAGPALCFSGIRNSGGVTLTVEDNGIGIPRQDLGHVFEKGFIGKNGRSATRSAGIGLYLCKQLCAKMGLGISIASLEGSGTAVSFVFPDAIHSPTALQAAEPGRS